MKGKVYFANNELSEGYIKVGFTTKSAERKEALLSQGATYPKPFNIFAFFTVSDAREGEKRIKSVLINKGFESQGGNDEVFKMVKDDIKKIWPELKKCLKNIFLYEEAQRIRLEKEACSCAGNSKIKSLKRSITLARKDKSIGQILDNMGSMLNAKNIKLPPRNLQNDTKLNLLKLQEMTGIDRNNIYNWINNGGSTSKLVQEVGFCACCQKQILLPQPKTKINMVVEIQNKIRELYVQNKYVRKVIDVSVLVKKNPTKRYTWNANLLLINGIQTTTAQRNYQTNHLEEQTVKDNTLRKLVNPDIDRLDNNTKVQKEEHLLHCQICSYYGFTPESIDVQIITGRRFDPSSFETFRKYNQSFNEYSVLVSKYFILADGSKEETPVDNVILEIGRLASLLNNKTNKIDFFIGRQDSKSIKVKLQEAMRLPVFVEKVYKREASPGEKARYAAIYTIGRNEKRDVLLHSISKDQLKKNSSIPYCR